MPLANDNNPNEAGILTLNYVQNNAGCSGNRVCEPSIAASDKVRNPFNAVQALRVVNQTADGTQACAGQGAPVTTDQGGVPLEACGAEGFGPSPSVSGPAAPTTMVVITSMDTVSLPTAAAMSTSAATTVSV